MTVAGDSFSALVSLPLLNSLFSELPIRLECISFACGDQRTLADSKLAPDCFIGVRMLARSAFGISTATLRGHPTWRSHTHLEKECTKARVTRILADQLRADKQLPSDAWVAFLLCCDDYQRLHADEAGFDGLSRAPAIMHALATWMGEGEPILPVACIPAV